MKYDVLIIIPPALSKQKMYSNFEYLGAGYLAACLDSSIKCGILDAYNYRIPLKKLIGYILDINPKLLAISCNFFLAVPSTVKLINELREKGYRGHISLGGHGATSCKESLIGNLDINSICLSEGESCFPDLVNNIVNNLGKYNINGYWIKVNNEVIKNERCSLIKDLDSIKFPIRNNIFTEKTTVEDLDKKFFTIITSRGCPYNCYFCDIKTFYGQAHGSSWRMRSAKNIVDEIEYLVVTTGITNFFFGDDNFIGSCPKGRARAIEFCNELRNRKLNITFSIEGRVCDVERGLFNQLKDVGLTNIMLGVESGCQRMLDTWNKNLKVHENEEAIKLLNELKIDYHINFILYDMYSTLEEMYENYNFIKRTGIYKQYNPIHLFNNNLGIYPNTYFDSELNKKGILRNYKLPEFDEFEQKIFDLYQPLRTYDIKDEKMSKFIENQSFWRKQISDKISYMNDNNLDMDKWYLKSGYLYLKLFKLSIDAANNSIDPKSQICDMINDYDKKTIGFIIDINKTVVNL